MTHVIVLGPGCANCERLMTHADQAVQKVRALHPEVQVTLEKITDYALFLDFGLLKTPGLVIGEQLVSSGRIPAPEQIAEWIENALEQEGYIPPKRAD